MNQYEMMCVLPGTMTEDEVAAQMDMVAQILTSQGAAVDKQHAAGKNRLAYPMKHIRYGYFHLLKFSAEPEQIKEIRRKIELGANLLRLLIRTQDPKQEGLELTHMTAIDRDAGKRQRKSGYIKIKKPAEPEKTVPKSSEEEPAGEKTASKPESEVTLEQIDEKLDELLEKDLEKV